MPFPVHDDAARWQREHPRTYVLHRYCPVSDDGRPPSFPRATALGRASTTDPAYWSSGRTRPDDMHWIFCFTLRGEGLLAGPTGHHVLRPGHGILVRAADPDSVFGYPPGATARWEWVWCDFSGSAASAMAADLVARHGPVFALGPHDAALRWMQQITAPGSARTVLPWDARERVWQLLGSLAEACEAAAGRPEDIFVMATRRRIAQRLTDHELSVEALATDMGVSREHLTRTFRRITGVTPRRHIEDLRLAQARQLLRETGLSIIVIARQCGWRDAETFSAAFARGQGCSPSRWRGPQDTARG